MDRQEPQGTQPTGRSDRGPHADLHADIASLLALVEKASWPAAATAVVALHDVLEAHVQTAANTNRLEEMVRTMVELTPAFSKILQRQEVMLQKDPPGLPAPPGSLTRVKWAAAAITLLIVQQVAVLPADTAQSLLRELRPATSICLRLAACLPVDEGMQSEEVARNIHSAARLATVAAAEREGLPLHACTPLLEMAERCRVGVDADVASRRQRADAAGGQLGDSNWASIWAGPLCEVMQALMACVMAGEAEMPQAAAETYFSAKALLLHEAAPLSNRKSGQPGSDLVPGILAPLCPFWENASLDQRDVQVLKLNGMVLLTNIGDAMQATCERLPEAAGGQEATMAAVCAATRIGDILCLSVNRGLPLLGESLLNGTSAVRDFGTSIAEASRRVSALLRRRHPVAPPTQGGVFVLNHNLGVTATTLLRLALAAGPGALKQKSVQAATLAAAGHVTCLQLVLHDFLRVAATAARQKEQLVMDGFRAAAEAIGEAAQVVLAAGEAQPPRRVSATLLSTICTAVTAFFGLSQIESTYLLVRRPPSSGNRPDLAALQRGAALVDWLLRAFGPAAERYLGGACAQELLFALETAANPRLAPTPLPPIQAACSALGQVLRRGGNWAPWDPQQPDVWQYIPGGWANMTSFLPTVVQIPPGQQEAFDKQLDETSDAMEFREAQLESGHGS